MKARKRSDRGAHRWVAVVGILLLPARGHAQDATEAVSVPVPEAVRERPRLVAVRTNVAPSIDGDVRDAAWERAAPTTVHRVHVHSESASHQ